jgi:hypothetical protein
MWLIDHVDRVRRLRTSPTNGLIVHPPDDMCGESWWWWGQLGKTPDWSVRAHWQSYQQRHTGASIRNGRRSENFACQYLRYVSRSFTCCKVLWRGASSFTFHPKEGVCCRFLSPRPGLNLQPLGPVAKHTNHYMTEATWCGWSPEKILLHVVTVNASSHIYSKGFCFCIVQHTAFKRFCKTYMLFELIYFLPCVMSHIMYHTFMLKCLFFYHCALLELDI